MLIAHRYRLGASLGRGGMGEVFRATDVALGREVAVKVMLRSQEGTAAEERFQREARAAARLSDPHIVAVYDFGQADDNFYLVMELVEGSSVAAELAEHGPLPWDRAVDIVEQAAAGLAAAHAQNVVHRDIKPSNLLVAADGTVKVADFGIAHLPGSETSDLTVTGQIMGSPHYLSPERARGLRGGPESDVYALGCVLYQLVTGRPPFVGDHPTAVLYQHVDTAPVPPSQLRPDLAGRFEPVLLRMLAKAPEDRPTAAQLTALPAAADWFPTAALPSESPAEPVAEPPAVTPEPTPVARSRKPLFVAAVAALALAGAVTAGVVLRGAGDNLPPTGDVGPKPSTSAGTPSPSEPAPVGRTSEPTSGGSTTSTTSTTPTSPTSTTPSTSTPTTPTSTPTSSPTPSTQPSPTPTPTKSPSSATSSPTSPTSSTTSTPPTTSNTPEPSETPAPSNTPPPSNTPNPQ
ncbi:serine/threonine-protein kinase [Kribbella shirazensis]|uniref:non-specific serine/threonine protein kinase n=1 Tax=Kribbella shirazensis TaxID=1105143 RepID=A0A7X5VC23_9ACTN|nr:serine/threonine-protein kinase [Kribbella shirazensis]NIK58470.1 serine/threonine-protein kinase [Kribbella shirazensis]